MAYPDRATLIAASTVEALTGLTNPQQDALRTEAITAVEAYCSQAFTQEGETGDPVGRSLDGDGTRTLHLPKRLIELVTLSTRTGPGETSGSVDVGDVVLSDDRDRLSIPGGLGASSWATRAVAELEGAREAVFPAGPETVVVEGVWGWSDAEFPPEVGTALRFHMEDRALAESHKLAGTVRAARALGVEGVRQGNVDFPLGVEPLLSARAKREVADLRWLGPIAAVV